MDKDESISEKTFSVLLTAVFALILLFLSFFVMAIDGTGNHGHMGLFDIYEFYLASYWSFVTIVNLLFFNARYLKKLGKSYGVVVLYLAGINLAIGFYLLYRLITAHFAGNISISASHYIWLLVPVLALGTIFAILAREQYRDYVGLKISLSETNQ